jgi:hypothetical protein
MEHSKLKCEGGVANIGEGQQTQEISQVKKVSPVRKASPVPALKTMISKQVKLGRYLSKKEKKAVPKPEVEEVLLTKSVVLVDGIVDQLESCHSQQKLQNNSQPSLDQAKKEKEEVQEPVLNLDHL